MKVLICLLNLLSVAFAADLIMNGGTMTLGGIQTFGVVSLTNGAVLTVPTYNGDPINSGNLEIFANSFLLDATSTINARGKGHQPGLCRDGDGVLGDNGSPTGGAGGCSAFDSGGGGGHFGAGGFGTKDCPVTTGIAACVFPRDQEENCFGSVNTGGTACVSYTNCRNSDGLPLVSGDSKAHTIYERYFGAAGGDKGCRDGDGFPAGGQMLTGGSGGGRVFINVTGTATVSGKIITEGTRGCGTGNDSGGGGAGGTIVILANTITLSSTSLLTAAGGLGGDSQPKDLNRYPECTGTQLSGTCDDCGGGGGGGLIYLSAPNGNYLSQSWIINNVLLAGGALGGACVGCNYEAGGFNGWIQLGSSGEICDGIDNTYDGLVDEPGPGSDIIYYPECGYWSCNNGNFVPRCTVTTGLRTTAEQTTSVTTALRTTAQQTTSVTTAQQTTAQQTTAEQTTAQQTTAEQTTFDGTTENAITGNQVTGSQVTGNQVTGVVVATTDNSGNSGNGNDVTGGSRVLSSGSLIKFSAFGLVLALLSLIFF